MKILEQNSQELISWFYPQTLQFEGYFAFDAACY